MEYVQATVELHLTEHMVGRVPPTCFPDNFGPCAEMLHYINISTLIANYVEKGEKDVITSDLIKHFSL